MPPELRTDEMRHAGIAMSNKGATPKAAPTPSALDRQEGGDHYKKQAIQPVQYIHANGIGYFEGNVIKYVTRWRDKNGVADLLKAKHYIELLIDLERARGEQT
jgi:Protein of unknwon function (DUF3310)